MFLYLVCDVVVNGFKVLQFWLSYMLIYLSVQRLLCYCTYLFWQKNIASCYHCFYRKLYLIQNHLVSQIPENYNQMICNSHSAQQKTLFLFRTDTSNQFSVQTVGKTYYTARKAQAESFQRHFMRGMSNSISALFSLIELYC